MKNPLFGILLAILLISLFCIYLLVRSLRKTFMKSRNGKNTIDIDNSKVNKDNKNEDNMKRRESNMDNVENGNFKSPILTFIGHASVKIKSVSGKVIYIDPYFPSDEEYKEPADFILVSHDHHDHNMISLCTMADDCKVITWKEALVDGKYQVFDFGDIRIEAVPSGGNQYHDVNENAGFICTVDGVSVYHAGDTSMNEDKNIIAKKQIDYAMYPVDGVYNMDAEEASKVSDLIGATHNIPIHGYQQDTKMQFQAFTGKGKLILDFGQKLELVK